MKAVMQLKDYTIDNINFSLNESSYMCLAEIDSDTDQYEFDHEILQKEESNVFLIKLRIKCNQGEAATVSHRYSFCITLKGIFGFDEGVSEDIVERAITLNGISILYGIARGIISQVSGQTVVGMIVLPTVNFIEYFREKNKLDDGDAMDVIKEKKSVKKPAKKKNILQD
jgi:preprotein translocase subunit SecB